MSVAPMVKLTLAGRRADKERALAALQDLGCLHVLNLAATPREPETVPTRAAEDAMKAWQYLAVVPGRRRQIRKDPNFDVEAFTQAVLDLKQQIREANDRRDHLLARIKEVTPWGNLNFPPKAEIAGNLLWFYCLPRNKRAALETVELPWEIMATDTRFIYLVVLSPDEPRRDLLPVERTHVGSRPLLELEEALEDVEIELEAFAAERLSLTRYLGLLGENLSEAATRAEFDFAAALTHDEDALFAIQGWMPEDALPAVTEIVDRIGLAMTVAPPDPDEVPPTLLLQADEDQAGVDLATVYQVPNYWAWDPSRLLIGSFAIFFAMILADAGYGAVILLGILGFWRRFGGSVRGRAWRRMALIISGAAIGYGILVGSYFGAPAPTGWLAALKILDLNDFDTMMRLSIVVGVIHLCMAIAMGAWVKRHKRSAIANVGWLGVVLGGLTLWLSGQAGMAGTVGMALLAGGFGAVFLFTSDRPVQKPLDWLWRLLEGLKGLTGIMGAFGDVLSYMRLFALGLASGSLALTFNDLADSVAASTPGLGVLGAVLILLVGHLLNFALGLMSGVVHGLRLNFIEFYKWGLPAEGVAFRPLARQEISG